ncbi:hypothetical protein QJQ45_007037 [Haematococcus lacustris]|nr:hypothetical protein QJQ45_007037 [Haematococcus lacustris]
MPPKRSRKRPVSPAPSAAGASGSGQQVQGQGQAAKVVIAERRQVIKAGLRGLVKAALPDFSPAQVDAILDIWDPQLLVQIKNAMELLTNATVLEHMMRGPHHRNIRLLPGEEAVFEQPSSAWPVAMLKQQDEVHLTGDGNSLNANATKIITSITEYYRHPGRFIKWWGKAVGVVEGGFSRAAQKHLPQLVLGRVMAKKKRKGTIETDSVSVCVHYTRLHPPPPAPPPAAISNSGPSAAAAAAHAVGLPHIGKAIAEQHEFVLDPATQVGVGIDPGVTQAVSAASDSELGQLRWLAPIQPHPQHLAAASSAGTSLEANRKHITVTLATWDAVWEVYLDPKWARQRLRLYGAQDRALEQFFNKLEEDMVDVSMERHGRAKQLVVYFGTASIGTAGGWGADAVLRACCKVLAVNGKQPCEEQLNKLSATRRADWKPAAGHMDLRLLRPAWSQQRDQPVRGLMWCPVVAPRKPHSPHAAARQLHSQQPRSQGLAPAKRSERTEAEQAAEPTQPTDGEGKGKAAKAKPAPQPGRWLGRDCNAALNMQRIGESRWRPLELCYWPDQGALPAKGKEYPGLGYKRLRDRPLVLWREVTLPFLRAHPKLRLPRGAAGSVAPHKQEVLPAGERTAGPLRQSPPTPFTLRDDCYSGPDVLNKRARFCDRDVSAALNIRRLVAGPGPRPRELSSWLDRLTQAVRARSELWEEYKEQLEGRVLYRPGKEARVGVVIHCQYHDYVSQYAPFYMVRWDGEQVTCAEPLDEVLRCLTDTFAPERWVPIDLRLAQANGWHRPEQEQMAMLCALVKRQAEDAGSRPGPPTASDASSYTAIAPAAVPGRSWEAGARPEALAGRKISYCDRAVFVQTGAAANGQGLFTKMQAALLEQQTAPKQISTLPLPLTNRTRQPPLTATTSSNAATESATTTTTMTTKQASASTLAQAGQQGKAKRPRPQPQAVPQGLAVASDTATQPAASKQCGDKAGGPGSSTGQKSKASAGSALPSASKRKPDRSASAAEEPAPKQTSKKGPAATAARHTPKATPPATPVPPSPHGSLAAAAVLAGLRHGSDGLSSPASPSALSSGGGKSPAAPRSASASGRKKGSGSGKAGRRVSVGRGGSMQQQLGEGEMRGVTGRVYPAHLCCCPGDKEDDGSEDGDFEVDWIVDEAGKGKETMYLIKWKGYKLRPGSPGSKGDWEPLANVRDTPAWDAWVKHPKPSYF